jgi:aminotransferase
MTAPAKPDIRQIARLVSPEGNLVQGQSELPIPEALARAAADAIARGQNHYTFFEGVADLRAVLAEKVLAHNGIRVDAAASPVEVMITPGATGALVAAAHAYLKGASALLFEPYYPYHQRVLETAGARAEIFPLRGDRLEIDPDELRSRCRAAARRAEHPLKAVVVCSPSNPTGKAMTRDELELVAEVCRELDLLCISDEVYEHFTVSAADHVSMATLPGMFERTITCNSFSKSWRISGWRLGFAVGHGPLVSKLHGPGNVFYVCAPTPLQHALAEVLMADPGYYDAQREEFRAKRERAEAVLERLDFGIYPSPSSFYLWVRIPTRFSDAMEVNARMLERAGVAGVPGNAFADDPAWTRWMRLCIAREDAMLDGALERIERALS